MIVNYMEHEEIIIFVFLNTETHANVCKFVSLF